MDTWIAWIIGCSVAYWIGQFVGKHIATISLMRALSNDPNTFLKMAEQIKKIEEANTQAELDAIDSNTGTEITVEIVGDQLYAYVKDTDQFLGQAKDLNTLLKTVNERFPGQGFFGTISSDDPAKELVK